MRPLSYRELALRGAFAIHRRHPARRPASHRRQDVHARDLRQRRDHAAVHARAGTASAAPVERSHARVQGHRAAVARQPVRARARARASSVNILGATSGDTGSSAEYALRGKRGVNVFMLSPHGRMSPFQTAQMFSLDRRQHPQPRHRGHVRRLPGPREGGQRRRRVQVAIRASAPSTRSTGRAWRRRSSITSPDISRPRARMPKPVDFAVPSGNFGNILAGHVARELGLPIRRLILATNENDVLDEFFRTGRYRPRGVGRDARHVLAVDGHLQGVQLRALHLRRGRPRSRGRSRRFGRSLAASGGFDLAARRTGSACSRRGFVSGRSTHADRVATIRDIDARYGVVVDPHTADGLKVGREHRDPAVPLVCLETALPVKFGATIREALGRDPARPAGIRRHRAAAAALHRAARDASGSRRSSRSARPP